MQAIWKFYPDLNDSFPQRFDLPRGAQILTFQAQRDALCFWALCDVEAPREPRWFAIYGTGQKIPAEPGTYIGTAQLSGLVLHFFEVAA